jgi:hypothetical protein
MGFRVLALLACLKASAAATPVALAHTPRVVSARVLAAVDHEAATERPNYARAAQKVTLYALVEIDDGGRRTYYSDAPAVRLRGRTLTVAPIARAPALAIAWLRVEPANATYSNTDEHGGNFHFESIVYKATPIDGVSDHCAITANVRPTLTADHGHGVGTMRYQIAVTLGDQTVASPGVEARRGRGSGGLTDDVLRVSIRSDDTYLGYLTEMYGQPYIWASAGVTDATHQSERLEGADCADFVVYGARRAGKQIAYTWTGGLPKVTTLLAAGTHGAGGIYRDDHGKPVPFTAKGDLVLFPRHVAVLVEDRGTIGVLDDQDLVMHILFDSPKQVPIADTGYADQAVELRRFR